MLLPDCPGHGLLRLPGRRDGISTRSQVKAAEHLIRRLGHLFNRGRMRLDTSPEHLGDRQSGPPTHLFQLRLGSGIEANRPYAYLEAGP